MDDLHRLRSAAQKARNSQAKADRDPAEAHALILDVRDHGMTAQAATCRATDLTRDHIRRIIETEHKRRNTVAE